MTAGRVVGLPGSGAWALLARCLLEKRRVPGLELDDLNGPLVLVCPDQETLEDVADAYGALAPLFSPGAPAPAVLGEDERGRLAALEQLRAGARLVVAVPDALKAELPKPDAFRDDTVRLRCGDRVKRDHVLERLARAGYQRVDFVESPGEFAARGAVVDFYGLEPLRAVRVLFDEDAIASMRAFEPTTQATMELLTESQAVPAQAESAERSGGRLADWVGPDALWAAPEGLEVELPQDARVARAGVLLRTGEGDLDFGARPNGPWTSPEGAWAEMARRAAEGRRVVLYSLNRGEDQRVQELLEGRLAPGTAQFLTGPLREGFDHPGLGLSVYTTSEIFKRRYRPVQRWKHFVAKGGLRFRDLRQGDYVVHQDYGVSRYRGLKPVESPGHGTLDCLLLEFRGEDRLYIPMTEFGRIQKYSGAEGKRPRLSSLDTRKWDEIKRQVAEGVAELAEQLLKTQAERSAKPAPAFTENPMEMEFAAAFPYEETPDQAQAIRDVLDDLIKPVPMDRVVIGDVGFGKTEVAMRAAFKAATSYKQVALIVPTTILADQHFQTFSNRMRDYPVRLAILTRFQTPAQQKSVIAGLKKGDVDIVIGTARLLQKDVSFKDLGLVVVDEEHRFGVKDKEKCKRLRASVHYLSLSATPIPRTLNQALSGLRGISLIQSAPVGRQPIVTKVGPWDEGVVAQAITEELARGGQVYYVHNRVRSMGDTVKRLEKLLPGVRFEMVHGQMSAQNLERAMWEFFNRKADVLVASTIIESGLDIPSVNTLLVEDAHDFGLAQLYQLRGRVGRERQRAYCYLFFAESHGDFSALSEDARKRLEALREFGELGAGVKLAMRDLEIRGAGELLGARQHGYMNAVGVEFYSQLLNDQIAERLGRARAQREPDVQMDVRVPAFIPETYLPDEMRRLDYYKRILRAKASEVDALRRELEDLSGPAPEPVRNLFALLRVRALAQRAGARSVIQKGSVIEVHFRGDAKIDPKTLSWWRDAYKGKLAFVKSKEGDGVSVEMGAEDPLKWLEDFLLGPARA